MSRLLFEKLTHVNQAVVTPSPWHGTKNRGVRSGWRIWSSEDTHLPPPEKHVLTFYGRNTGPIGLQGLFEGDKYSIRCVFAIIRSGRGVVLNYGLYETAVRRADFFEFEPFTILMLGTKG